MTELQLAWAAGLFDGEGCISITMFKPRGASGEITPRYRMWAALAMCDAPTVKRFSEIVDGGARVYVRRQKTWKHPHWEWRACDVLAERVIATLLPYLQTKRAQAEAAMKYRDLCRQQQVGRNRRVGLTEPMLAERAAFHKLLRDMKAPTYQGEAAYL